MSVENSTSGRVVLYTRASLHKNLSCVPDSYIAGWSESHSASGRRWISPYAPVVYEPDRQAALASLKKVSCALEQEELESLFGRGKWSKYNLIEATG